MLQKTKIECTEMTWNPAIGCTKISPGCKNCYAEKIANRLKDIGNHEYKNGFLPTLLPQRLNVPLARKKATLFFVNSMSDLFHEEIPDDYLDQVFQVILSAKQHTFQILTKRSERLSQYFSTRTVPYNVWLGVSVENKRYGLPRIDHLRKIQAKVKFVTIEPLLEDLGTFDLSGIDWVILGGETGSKARPMKKEWAESVKNQCDSYPNIAFFFKQWGEWGPDGIKRTKKLNGKILCGKIWEEYPHHKIKTNQPDLFS